MYYKKVVKYVPVRKKKTTHRRKSTKRRNYRKW